MISQDHVERFCAAMDEQLQCRSPKCEKLCWARALLFVEKKSRDGMPVEVAVKKWAETGLTHKDGEEIIADFLGVDDLDTVRDLLREEKND
jgi:hypothetical protein